MSAADVSIANQQWWACGSWDSCRYSRGSPWHGMTWALLDYSTHNTKAFCISNHIKSKTSLQGSAVLILVLKQGTIFFVRFYEGEGASLVRNAPLPKDSDERLKIVINGLVDIPMIMGTMRTAIRQAVGQTGKKWLANLRFLFCCNRTTVQFPASTRMYSSVDLLGNEWDMSSECQFGHIKGEWGET